MIVRYSNQSSVSQSQREKNRRISSIVKLVNARDPINNYFESTVNLANKDAWKRRSIYLSKAKQFDPDVGRAGPRHTVMNPTLDQPPLTSSLSREDSADDELWGNVDEGIGENDRVIPVITPPKWMTFLLDRFLPIGISNLLRKSTRFSHSFHVGGSSKKTPGSSSTSTARFKSRIATKTEESKNTFTNSTDSTGFFGYQKHSDVYDGGTIPRGEDPWNFEEEKWVREKTLNQNKETLKTYENEKKGMDRLIDKDAPREEPKQELYQDEALRRITEIDNKKRALSEITVKPKKNLNTIISKATPFAVAPTENPNHRTSESDKVARTNSTNSKSDDRASVDLWRASQPAEAKKEEIIQEDPEEKDQILDQWLNRDRPGNGTITEDVDAEDEEDSSRMSRSTTGGNTYKTTVAKPALPDPTQSQNQNEEDEENELHKIHMLQSLQALQYMKKVSLPPVEDLSDKFVYLPPPKNPLNKKTLIFDMDETLIHCVDDIELERPQVVLDVEFEDGEIVEAGINVRPFAIDCLKAANELFQVIVFTASHKCYADVVLDHIDPTGELIQHRLYRDSWYKTDDNVYIKDLRIIQNRNIEDMVIVDNAVYSFGFQLDNGIPIIPYYEDPEDEELYHLIPYLDILAEEGDVREKNREAFQLREMAKENTEDLNYFER